MKRITQKDLQGLYAPVPPSLAAGVHQALSSANERKETKPVKKKLSMAMLVAAMLALASVTALAAGGSRLLADLFPAGKVPEQAAALLNAQPYSATKNGITLTVTESLFDGAKLIIQAELTNGTDETLFAAVHCGSADRLPVSGTPAEIIAQGDKANTLFDYGAFFNRILPGQTITGSIKCNYSGGEAADDDTMTASLEAHVMHALTPVEPIVGDLYAFDALSEPAGEEFVTIPLTIPVHKAQTSGSGSTVCLATNEFRMTDYTLYLKELSLAPASTKIAFEIVPDDPADADFVIFGDDVTLGRLNRSYVILDETGQSVPFSMEAWVSDGALHYVCDSAPFAEAPKALSIVPTMQGEPLMDEACTIRLAAE